MVSPKTVYDSFQSGKEAIEFSNELIQKYGSEITGLIPGLSKGTSSLKCTRCNKNLKLHKYYVANDNYA